VLTTAGGVAALRIARWDGAIWSPLADGMNYRARARGLDGGGGPRSTPAAFHREPRGRQLL
jgi:hypothetical protein